MYSHEIERLLKIKQYILSYNDYANIITTSPQINNVKYNKDNDTFEIKTDDRYNLKFKVKSMKNNFSTQK